MRLSGKARALTLELYAEASAEWGHASDLIARAFRSHRALGSGERRLVAETTYGLIRQTRRLEAIMAELAAGIMRRTRRPAGSLPPRSRDELKLLLYELRWGGVPVEALREDVARLLGDRLDLAPVLAVDAGLDDHSDLDREAVRLSYPTWMVERLVADLGRDQALALAEAMNQRAPLTIRANSIRKTRDELRLLLEREGIESRPTPLATSGLILDTRVNVFSLAAFRDGLFEVMDEGSQLVAEAVAPPPGGRVVDACAGAGGKTLAVGAALGGRGRLLGLDVSGKKLEELRRRARRAGLTSVTARPLAAPGNLPHEARLAAWDRVLVDAPCSGLGTLRRNPEARWRLSPADVARFPAEQISLLVTFAPLVEVGGRLVYATCTVLADENERVVDRFLAERADFVRMPLKEIWGKERAERLGDGSFLRVYPHVHDTDGFFAAVLRRIR